MRIGCMTCGKSVSTEVPGETVVRAFVECPECLEKKPDYEQQMTAALRDRDELQAAVRLELAVSTQRLKERDELVERLRGLESVAEFARYLVGAIDDWNAGVWMTSYPEARPRLKEINGHLDSVTAALKNIAAVAQPAGVDQSRRSVTNTCSCHLPSTGNLCGIHDAARPDGAEKLS